MSTTTERTILADLGLTTTAPAFETRVVRAKVTQASQDVALLSVLATPSYEAVMPVTEFYPGRSFVKDEVLVLEQLSAPPRPLLSAIRPELVALLIDGVVPEVRAGLVRIMGVARAAGERTKLAVAPTESGVDPVAACVGRGANRIRSISEQLGGERVDVISWHPDTETYLRNALAPAGVGRIVIDAAAAKAIAVAPAHQMSAAVGGGGLNAALAGQLVGLRVVVVAEGTDVDALADDSAKDDAEAA